MTDTKANYRISAMETLTKDSIEGSIYEAGSEMADTGPDRRAG